LKYEITEIENTITGPRRTKSHALPLPLPLQLGNKILCVTIETEIRKSKQYFLA